jgi:hypothetical protein
VNTQQGSVGYLSDDTVAQRVLLVALGAADGGHERRGAVRVPVRRVRVHVHVPAVAVAVAVCSVVDVRRRRRLLLLLLLVADGGGAHGGGGAVLEVDAREVARGDGVDDERADGADHGAEPREGEVLPRPVGEAIGRELLERVGEDVDEPRGQDDPRRERLDQEEHVPVGAQRRHAPPQHGQAAAQRPAHEDGEEGRDLQRPGPRAVARRRLAAARRPAPAAAVVGARAGREEEEEDQRDAGCQGEGERGAWPHGHGSAARRWCVDGTRRGWRQGYRGGARTQTQPATWVVSYRRRRRQGARASWFQLVDSLGI